MDIVSSEIYLQRNTQCIWLGLQNSFIYYFMDTIIGGATASEIDVVKIVEHENLGVRATYTSRMTIGYVLLGTKYIYHNDRSVEIKAGDIFILDVGHHYIENSTNENSHFEEVLFYLSSATLQRVIYSLNINYGLSFSSSHSCSRCAGVNFVAQESSPSLRNFFSGINISLQNTGLVHNDIRQRIKLNELIFLLLTDKDSCLRRKLLRSADATSAHFMNTIYENIFNDISVEALAERTNRSLTSFKKEFKRVFGAPPHRWIIEQRLVRAKIMLTSTNRTVSEIGAECGFSNISHFIKLFRTRYATTPALFRRDRSIAV